MRPLMALVAFRGRKCPLPVMTGAAVPTRVHVLHGNMSGPCLHEKNLRMTFFTTKHFRMGFMVEARRHARILKSYHLHTMAIAAYVRVDLHMFMPFDLVTLVAVISRIQVGGVREYTLLCLAG